jgi:hypothetical protein
MLACTTFQRNLYLPHQALNYLANGAAASCEASWLYIYQTTRCQCPQTIVNNNKKINLELPSFLHFFTITKLWKRLLCSTFLMSQQLAGFQKAEELTDHFLFSSAKHFLTA